MTVAHTESMRNVLGVHAKALQSPTPQTAAVDSGRFVGSNSIAVSAGFLALVRGLRPVGSRLDCDQVNPWLAFRVATAHGCVDRGIVLVVIV